MDQGRNNQGHPDCVQPENWPIKGPHYIEDLIVFQPKKDTIKELQQKARTREALFPNNCQIDSPSIALMLTSGNSCSVTAIALTASVKLISRLNDRFSIAELMCCSWLLIRLDGRSCDRS